MEKSRSISEDLRRSRQERGDQEERSHRVIADFPVFFQVHHVFLGHQMQLVGSRSWGLPNPSEAREGGRVGTISAPRAVQLHFGIPDDLYEEMRRELNEL